MASRTMSQSCQPTETRPLPEGDAGPTRDEIFHLLQCRRRRDALRYLRGHDGPVRMCDLAEQVAAWEHDTTLEALSSTQRQRVYIPLYQDHLPKLDEAGVIDYDQERGAVERTPLADRLDHYLDGAPAGGEGCHAGARSQQGDADVPDARTPAGDASTTNEPDPGRADDARDWTRYYLGALAASAAAVGGVAFGVSPLSGVPPLAVGVLVPALFGLVSLAEHRQRTADRAPDRPRRSLEERRSTP